MLPANLSQKYENWGVNLGAKMVNATFACRLFTPPVFGIYLVEKTLSPKSISHKRWGFKNLWVYVISKANSKFFRQKFTLSWDARADANPSSTLLKACCCLFLSFKNAFRSYLMIFKCALANDTGLRSLTVEISYLSSTGEVWAVLRFLECIVANSFVNENIFEKNFTFAMLVKLYP